MFKAIKPIVLVFLPLAALALLLSACGEEAEVLPSGPTGTPYIIGSTAAGPNTHGAGGANVFTTPITVPNDTYVVGVGVYLKTAGLDWTLGIYDDNAGVANALLASGGLITSIDGDNSVNVTPTFLAAGNYWLAQENTTGASFSYYAETVTGTVSWMNLTAGDPMPTSYTESGVNTVGFAPSAYLIARD